MVMLQDNGICLHSSRKVRITRKAGSGNSLPAEIKEQIFTGNMMKHIAVLSNGHEIKVADIASYNDINIGDKVYLEWDAKDAVMIKIRQALWPKILTHCGGCSK